MFFTIKFSTYVQTFEDNDLTNTTNAHMLDTIDLSLFINVFINAHFFSLVSAPKNNHCVVRAESIPKLSGYALVHEDCFKSNDVLTRL